MTFLRSVSIVSLIGIALGPWVLGACGDDDSSGSGGTGGSAGMGGAGGGTGGASGAAGAGGSAGGGTGGSGGSSGASGSGGSAGSAGSPGLYDCSPASGTIPSLKLTQIAQGLEHPLLAVSPPADAERLMILEQDGKVSLYKNGALSPDPFLDISGRVTYSGERGALGLAFHPDYAQNGRFFVHYSGNGSTAPTGDTVVSEFTRSSANPDQADPASEKILLTVDQPEANHNGGSINVRNGLLFIGLGDGGGGGDQHGTIGNGQALDTLLGKILRIDPDNPAGGKNYGIPSGNMAGAEPEIWSYGLRNPFRWSFDACTGDMYIGDVGQNEIEEIDFEPANAQSGLNYGWRVMEGSQCYNPSSGCDMSGKVLPVAEYDHSKGCSVAGGYVYRGSAIPALRGYYFYGDYCQGRIWRFRMEAGAAADLQEITSDLNPQSLGVSSFGQDAKGELYVTTFSNGQVFRIEAE